MKYLIPIVLNLIAVGITILNLLENKGHIGINQGIIAICGMFAIWNIVKCIQSLEYKEKPKSSDNKRLTKDELVDKFIKSKLP